MKITKVVPIEKKVVPVTWKHYNHRLQYLAVVLCFQRKNNLFCE